MQHYPLNLSRYLNNDGISFETDVEDGNFDGLGNTYPAEKLPASKRITNICGTPMLFPDKSDGAFNNIALEAQQIVVSSSSYSTLAVIGASDSGRYVDGGYQDLIVFSYRENIEESAKLRLKDWVCIEDQRPGGYEALRCPYMHCSTGRCALSERGYETYPTLWYEEIEIDESKTLERIHLPDNPCMHIFSMTLIELKISSKGIR